MRAYHFLVSGAKFTKNFRLAWEVLYLTNCFSDFQYLNRFWRYSQMTKIASTVGFWYVNMRAYNFFVGGPKVTIFFMSNV